MKKKILFAGDSIVHGYSWQDWLPEYEVENLAFPGHTTSDMVDLLDAIGEFKPQLVVTMIGTNDFGKFRYSEETVTENVLALAKSLRAMLPDVPIIWNSLTPRSDEFSLSMIYVNSRLEAAFDRLGITYFDVFSVLKDPDHNVITREYCSDPDTFGLHLTDSGYAKWFEFLAPEILAALK